MTTSFIFRPVPTETMGRHNPSTLVFIDEIGSQHLWLFIIGDMRETTFLFSVF